MEEFSKIFSLFHKHRVMYTINTDGPEMLKTNLVNEYRILMDNGILSKDEILNSVNIARKSSFIHANR